VYPQGGRTFTIGTYRVSFPNPASGTWTLAVDNSSAWREPNQSLVSTEDAEYALTVRLLGASVRPRLSRAGGLDVDVENQGASLDEPVLQVSSGLLRSHRGQTLATGLPNQFDIQVPPAAATLALQLRNAAPSTHTFELYLYDCTTGECFSYNFTLPAGTASTPGRSTSGRWPLGRGRERRAAAAGRAALRAGRSRRDRPAGADNQVWLAGIGRDLDREAAISADDGPAI